MDGDLEIQFGPLLKDKDKLVGSSSAVLNVKKEPTRTLEDCIDSVVNRSVGIITHSVNEVVGYASSIRCVPEQESILEFLVGFPNPTPAEQRVLNAVRGKTKLFAGKISDLKDEWVKIMKMIADISRDVTFIFENTACSEDVVSRAYDILSQATGDATLKEIEVFQGLMNKLMVVAKLEIVKANETRLATELQTQREEMKTFEEQIKQNEARGAEVQKSRGVVNQTTNETPELDTTPLDTISINRRTVYYLKQHGIKDVETLTDWSESGLLGLRGIKQATVDQIKRALKAKRLKLAKV